MSLRSEKLQGLVIAEFGSASKNENIAVLRFELYFTKNKLFGYFFLSIGNFIAVFFRRYVSGARLCLIIGIVAI